MNEARGFLLQRAAFKGFFTSIFNIYGILILAGLVLPAWESRGQELRIGIPRVEAGSVSFGVSSGRDLYYVLDGLDLNTGKPTGVIDVELGSNGIGLLIDANPPPKVGFYQARGFSVDNPGDLDGDTIDDIYELTQPGLNPLNPSDADGQVELDGTATTRLDAYQNNYEVGRGMHDITGQAAQGAMMGYASGDQRSTGIHDRQWARAFIVRDRTPPHRRVVYVVVDNGQVFESISQGVHDKIRADSELREFYSHENIVLSATHTHGAAGGHSHFALYHLSIGGYSWRTYDALVHGIYMAIKKAHRDLKPGGIARNRGNLENANENRAPKAFLQNVEHAFPQLLGNPYGTDNRDTEMLALRFEQKEKGAVAMFNWFPVHGVSASKENTLLTGDNKGNAAYLFEKNKGAIYPGLPGYDSDISTFVAGFANSNPGDLTANRRTLEPPWPAHGENDFLRVTTIGTRQYEKALALFDGKEGKLAKVHGPIDYRHMYVDLNMMRVDPTKIYPYNVKGVGFPGSTTSPPWETCVGALGVEFAKGTLDGEALGQNVVNLLIQLGGTAPEGCQAPKDVLVTTASLDRGGLTPHWLPISILRVGDVVILAVPAEFTVTAGWRLRKTVEQVFAAHGQKVRPILSGLSNSYVGYVTTYEEYLFEELVSGILNQGYEAASTQFGAFTLVAYQTKFAELAEAMATGENQPELPSKVELPAHVRPDVPIVNPLDKVPFLDGAPPPAIVAATFQQAAGCPTGQFNDLLTGSCWSCPTGYQRTLAAVTGADACTRPAYSDFSGASQFGAAGCPVGQFFELFSGACWSCPAGFNQSALPAYDPFTGLPTSNGCHKPASSLFTAALSATATGGSDCPGGYVYDFTLGACYVCPGGYNKNVFRAWNDGAACEKTEQQATAASSAPGTGFFGTDCPGGYVFDFSLGRCYACPSTYAKHVFRAWNAGDACVKDVTTTVAALTTGGTGGTACPAGYVYDFTLGRCYRCPTDYNKLVFIAWNTPQVCEKVIPEQFVAATRQGSGGCPAGQFLDIGLGTCWSCPAGYVRTVFPVTGNQACEKVNAAVFAAATQHGKYACEARNPYWFLDIGRNECWSCPVGAVRNLNPVNGGAACDLPRNFGEIRSGPLGSYRRGLGIAQASFWAGHPGNVFGTFEDDLTNTIDTFFRVQKKGTNGEWVTVKTDADWDTTFEWAEVEFSGAATIKWVIPAGADTGTYRIVHRGISGNLSTLTPYQGTSPEFEVTQ